MKTSSLCFYVNSGIRIMPTAGAWFLWTSIGHTSYSAFTLEKLRSCYFYFQEGLDNKMTKRRCLGACSHMYFLSNNGKIWNVFVNTANKYPGALASTVGFFFLVEIQFICSFHWARRTGASAGHAEERYSPSWNTRCLYLLVLTGLRRTRNRGELKDKNLQRVSRV